MPVAELEKIGVQRMHASGCRFSDTSFVGDIVY